MSIDWNPLIEKCHAAAVANGWWEQPRPIEETLMLVVTEVAEAVEWYRDFKGSIPTDVYLPYRELPGDKKEILESVCPSFFGNKWRHWKPVGIPSELADVAIRVCDLMGHMKLEATCVDNQRFTFNDTPFLSQCFRLSRKITSVVPHDEELLGVELELCIRVDLCGVLACVRDIAAANGIDLAAAIETKLTYNATRGHRHGGKRA